MIALWGNGMSRQPWNTTNRQRGNHEDHRGIEWSYRKSCVSENIRPVRLEFSDFCNLGLTISKIAPDINQNQHGTSKKSMYKFIT